MEFSPSYIPCIDSIACKFHAWNPCRKPRSEASEGPRITPGRWTLSSGGQLLAFFPQAKKRMFFCMHFFRILADLASPGAPQNRLKSMKISLRRPFFCRSYFLIEFSLILHEFSCFFALILRGDSAQNFHCFLHRNHLEISCFLAFCRKTWNLKIISFTKEKHTFLAWRTLQQQPLFENALAKNVAKNTTEKLKKCMEKVMKIRVVCRILFGCHFSWILTSFWPIFGPKSLQNGVREGIRKNVDFWEPFFMIFIDFGPPGGAQNRPKSAQKMFPVGHFCVRASSFFLERCRKAFWTQKATQNDPKSAKKT